MNQKQPQPPEGPLHSSKQLASFIVHAVIATEEQEFKDELAPVLKEMTEDGYTQLVNTVHRIWEGERDESSLTRGLDKEDVIITRMILHGIDDPENLNELVRKLSEHPEESPEDREFMKSYAKLILGVVMGVQEPDARAEFEEPLRGMAEQGLNSLVSAILRIWEGERDESALTKALDRSESDIIHLILQGIADPENLRPIVGVVEEAMARGEEY